MGRNGSWKSARAAATRRPFWPRSVREVYTIERFAELSRHAVKTLESLAYDNITPIVGDGHPRLRGGSALRPNPRHGPAPRKSPLPCSDNWPTAARLVLPVGDTDSQVLHVVRRAGDALPTTSLTPCRFVPLIGKQGWGEDEA